MVSRPAVPLDAANVLGRGFDGRRPCTHVAADLTYVRAGSRWRCACLLVDLHDREIIGCSCGRRKDAALVKAALSNIEFPPRWDRGVPFRARAGVLQRRDRRDPGRLRGREVRLQARQPAQQRRGGVDEPYPEKGLVAGRRFGSGEGLRAALFDWVNW